MKIKHSDIETLRASPTTFLQREPQGIQGFAPASALRLAINFLHQNLDDLEKAHMRLTALCQGRGTKFKDVKIAEQHAKLDTYYSSYHSCLGRPCETAHNLSGRTPAGNSVVGQVARIDFRVTTGGENPYYFAWLFSPKPLAWKTHLRMPLIQYFMAQDLRCPTSEIAVGVYCHQTATHEWTRYSDEEMEQSLVELDRLIAIAAASE